MREGMMMCGECAWKRFKDLVQTPRRCGECSAMRQTDQMCKHQELVRSKASERMVEKHLVDDRYDFRTVDNLRLQSAALQCNHSSSDSVSVFAPLKRSRKQAVS